jgi:general secretion pathway protein J
MTACRRGSSEAGFTLIEALIATALFVLILATLATVTSQWLPNWNRGFMRAQRMEHFALGIERVIADLAAAEFITPNGTVKRPIFDGTELAVTFARSAVGPNAQGGLEIVRLAEIAGDRGPVLVRATAPFVPIEPDASAVARMQFSEPMVVVRAPFRVAFLYSGPDRVWRSVWRDADQLPSAVQVVVRDAVSGQTLTISSAVKVHVDAPAECANPKVRGCSGSMPQADETAAPKSNREP